ncbi:hypothetical protein JOC31_000005 [Streptococcus saliviloxodontae]|uniref:Uncharacterized protein n=1 Tax=Streptococcus saliviloxodontae TaxID=1349416 RepID=A0ABS2PIF7_9STRE|nr:hypothetical protein [Streptococcus saliviloxodontae]
MSIITLENTTFYHNVSYANGMLGQYYFIDHLLTLIKQKGYQL